MAKSCFLYKNSPKIRSRRFSAPCVVRYRAYRKLVCVTTFGGSHDNERKNSKVLIIFDSEQESAENIKKALQTECGINEKTISIFNGTPARLINIIKKDKFHSIKTIFIEISMKTTYNGIDAASEIARINSEIHIVFVTDYGKFYIQQAFLDCYELNPCAYLIKPVSKYFLKKTIDKINHTEKNKSAVWIKTQRTSIRLLTNEIIYIGIEGRCTVYHSPEQLYRSYTPMEETVKGLPQTFIRCHKSFIVNTQYITAYTPTRLILGSNIQIPISRSYQRIVKEYISSLTSLEVFDEP